VKNIIQDMVSFTESLAVDNDQAYKKITSLYRQAREWKKCLDAKRKEMTEPLRKQASSINDKAKELSDPLDRVIDLANTKANCYQKLLTDIKAKEDAKLREAASFFDTGEELYIPPMEKSLRGDGALLATKIVRRFRVTDMAKVPAKYLTIDAAAIEQDIKLGLGEIAGIEIYEELTTHLRCR
jgi:hypothetical protein